MNTGTGVPDDIATLRRMQRECGPIAVVGAVGAVRAVGAMAPVGLLRRQAAAAAGLRAAPGESG